MKYKIFVVFSSLLLLCVSNVESLAQNKSKTKEKVVVKVSDRHEFNKDMPVFLDRIKEELTYPMAWENSGYRSFKKWKKAGRAKVFEAMMTAPKPTENYDMKVFELFSKTV